MTIDERIEKLVERHEALAQTVELLTHQGIQQGERLEKQGEHLERQGEHIDRILLAISQDADNIRALANIAQAHQATIDSLERRMG